MGEASRLKTGHLRRTIVAGLGAFAPAVGSSAQPPYSAPVLEAFAATHRQCSDILRNHASYGYVLNIAVPQLHASGLVFEAQGHQARLRSGTHIDPFGEPWVRVGRQRDASVTGWVTGQALSTAFERLPHIDPNATRPRPMQAFYFRTGIGRPACVQAPREGMIIQRPRRAGRVRFTLDGAAIDFGSTGYVSSPRSGRAMCVSLLGGSAGLGSGGTLRGVLPGERSCVPVDAPGAASGAPGKPEAFDPDEIALIAPVLALLPGPAAIPTRASGDLRNVDLRPNRRAETDSRLARDVTASRYGDQSSDLLASVY